MADQNQNPLLPSLVEDEQFVSSEEFMSADTALDWDALVTRGNVNNSQQALNKWERDSLYLKFDPLIASRKEQADRNSFIFKAPKPPGPIKQNVPVKSHNQEPPPSSTDHSTTQAQFNGNLGDFTQEDSSPFLIPVSPIASKSGNGRVDQKEELLCASTPQKNEEEPEKLGAHDATVVISPDKACDKQSIAESQAQAVEVGVDDLCRDFERLVTKDASFTVNPKLPNQSQGRGETPETDVGELCEELEGLNTKQESVSRVSRTSPDEHIEEDNHHHDGDVEQLDSQDISMLIRAASPASTFGGDEEVEDRHRELTPEMVDMPTKVETPEKDAVVVSETVDKSSKQQNFRIDHPYADKLKRIAKLKESISQLNSRLEDEKKYKLKRISRQETSINDAISEYNKLKIRHEKSIEGRECAIEECNDAKEELGKLESRFTDLLMLYETVKNKTANVEKNCVILQKREEILTRMLQKRETRDQSMKDLYSETLEKVHLDFENLIRARQKELATLKAKIRLCEVQTHKLEAEIEQVDRESEELRNLCEDLMRS